MGFVILGFGHDEDLYPGDYMLEVQSYCGCSSAGDILMMHI